MLEDRQEVSGWGVLYMSKFPRLSDEAVSYLFVAAELELKQREFGERFLQGAKLDKN